MAEIAKSVGRGGVNRAEDVRTVRGLLAAVVEGVSLPDDDKIDTLTISLISYFQSRFAKVRPDGRIDPRGPTLILLNKYAAARMCITDNIGLPATGSCDKIKENEFVDAAATIGCDVAAVKAVAEVEARGDGFLPSRRPKILFEAHVFSRNTFHVFDAVYPEISSKKWNRALYAGGEAEYDRLIWAMALDRAAALKSASWGAFQIMGFNHVACGYGSVEDFVADMFVSEGRHLKAFVSFIASAGLAASLKTKNWAAFAAAYNGPEYAANAYDTKIAEAYKKYGGK